GPERRLVVESLEQRFERIDHDALRADGIDRQLQAYEQPVEIEGPQLLDVRAVDVHVVDDQQLAGLQCVQVVPERGDVPAELVGGPLEGDENPGLAVTRRTVDQEGGGEECLAAAGTAADQRRPPRRQAAARHLVEAFNAGRRLRQRSGTYGVQA